MGKEQFSYVLAWAEAQIYGPILIATLTQNHRQTRHCNILHVRHTAQQHSSLHRSCHINI